MVMHVVVTDEILNGMQMMKYSCNHWWKFSNPLIAYTSGLLQVMSMVTITLVNYFVIFQSPTILELAKDFTAFLIIANFDNYLSKRLNSYAEIDEISYTCLTDREYVDRLLVIETTTSNYACASRNVRLKKDPVLERLNERRKRLSDEAKK